MVRLKIILTVYAFLWIQISHAQNVEHNFTLLSGLNIQKQQSSISCRLGYRLLNITSNPVYAYLSAERGLPLKSLSYGVGLKFLINQSQAPMSLYGILDIYCSNKKLLAMPRFDSPIQSMLGIGYNIDRKSSIELSLASNFLFSDLKSFVNISFSRNLSYKTKIKRKHLTKCPD